MELQSVIIGPNGSRNQLLHLLRVLDIESCDRIHILLFKVFHKVLINFLYSESVKHTDQVGLYILIVAFKFTIEYQDRIFGRSSSIVCRVEQKILHRYSHRDKSLFQGVEPLSTFVNSTIILVEFDLNFHPFHKRGRPSGGRNIGVPQRYW